MLKGVTNALLLALMHLGSSMEFRFLAGFQCGPVTFFPCADGCPPRSSVRECVWETNWYKSLPADGPASILSGVTANPVGAALAHKQAMLILSTCPAAQSSVFQCPSQKFFLFFVKSPLTKHSAAVIIHKLTETQQIWGYSSAGRALEWHSRGQRFDPAYLHHRKSHRKPFGLRCFSLFKGKFQTFYTNLIFAQNRQNWVLSTKSVNKSVFGNKKAWKNRPADWTAFPLQKEKFTMCAYCAM